MWKRALLIVVAAVGLLAAILISNTLTYGDEGQLATVSPGGEATQIDLDEDRIIRNFSQSIRYKTISHQDPSKTNGSEFTGFLTWLEQAFPLVYATMNISYAGGLTPIYKWQGRDPAIKPVSLTGHYDVVPVLPDTLGDWTEPPFDGRVSDGFLWGRGTLDDKVAVVGILEAAEKLIADGFQPNRTLYFIFGHDEEVGGWQGAGRAVHQLKKQGIEMEWSLDEGSMVLDGILPGLSKPIASINVAEKGYVTLDLTAKGVGGHSSLPPSDTAVGILAKAITRLEENPVPGGITDVSAEFFDAVAPGFPFVQRMLFANRWLFGPLLESELSKGTATNAMLRTTTAPTMLSASLKENVLPANATATVNFRIHPRDSVDSVIAHVKTVLDDDRITVAIRGEGNEPSPVSKHDVPGFNHLSKTFLEIFGDLTVVPGLTIAATDSKHYCRIAENCYRINPVVFGPDDIPRFHGTNERISVEAAITAVRFYHRLISNLDADAG